MIGLHFYTDHKDTPLLGSLIKYFDKPFKPWQKTVISAVLEGKDTLIVQSTGAGKSLCFQFPCVAAKKVTIVIMPAVSLIIDQHHSLQEH